MGGRAIAVSHLEETRETLVSLAVRLVFLTRTLGLHRGDGLRKGYTEGMVCVKRERPESTVSPSEGSGNTSSKLVCPDLRGAENLFGLAQGILLRTPQGLKRIVFFLPWLLLKLLVLGPFTSWEPGDAPARYFLSCSL